MKNSVCHGALRYVAFTSVSTVSGGDDALRDQLGDQRRGALVDPAVDRLAARRRGRPRSPPRTCPCRSRRRARRGTRAAPARPGADHERVGGFRGERPVVAVSGSPATGAPAVSAARDRLLDGGDRRPAAGRRRRRGSRPAGRRSSPSAPAAAMASTVYTEVGPTTAFAVGLRCAEQVDADRRHRGARLRRIARLHPRDLRLQLHRLACREGGIRSVAAGGRGAGAPRGSTTWRTRRARTGSARSARAAARGGAAGSDDAWRASGTRRDSASRTDPTPGRVASVGRASLPAGPRAPAARHCRRAPRAPAGGRCCGGCARSGV